MAPSGGQKQVAKGVLPTPRTTEVLCDVGVFTESYLDRVVTGDISREAVANWFSLDFGAKRTEQAVPNNQHAGMVAIQISNV